MQRVRITLSVVILVSIFCNCSFDTETSVGKKLLNDNDSLLNKLDGVYREDSLPVGYSTSFVDMKGTRKSGLYRHAIDTSNMPIGTWAQERTIGYLRFSIDSLLRFVDTVSKNQYTLLSSSFTCMYDKSMSDTNALVSLEIGTCPYKPDTSYIDTTNFKWLSHFSFKTSDSTSYYNIPIGKNTLFDTTQVRDTVSRRDIKTFKKITTIAMKPDTIIFDTIPKKNIGKDTIILDTLTDGSLVIGKVITFKDTNVTSTMTLVSLFYDSITEPTFLPQKNQTIAISTQSIKTNADTMQRTDSVVTVEQTENTFKIREKITTTVTGKDTLKTTTYDTIVRITTISSDQIIQHSMSYLKTTLLVSIKNTNPSDVQRTFSVYTRLRSPNDNHLLFIRSLNFLFRFSRPSISKPGQRDTVLKTLYPTYGDYTTTAQNSSLLDTIFYTSGAAERYGRISLSLKQFWNAATAGGSTLKYHNVPKATMPLEIKNISIRSPLDSSAILIYYLAFAPVSSMEDLSNIPVTAHAIQIPPSTSVINLNLNKFLLQPLKTNGPLSDSAYIYLRVAPKFNCQVTFKKPNNALRLNYLLTNSQQ